MAESDQIVVDVKLLGSSFEDMMAEKLAMALNASIFKTPKVLFRHNENAYIPRAFSFGPFHWKDEQLKLTQTMKWKCMQDLLRRSRDPHLKWREIVDAVAPLKDHARLCYAGSIDLDDHEFIEVLVLDGCFIIELFRKDSGIFPKQPDDPTFAMSCFLEYLNHDLILLENQIPWLVLERLFSLTKASDSERESLITLTLEYFANIFSSRKPETKPEQFEVRNIKHILDLLRHSLVLPLEKGYKCSYRQGGWENCPSVMKMQQSGIKLQRVNSASILDIKFRSNGALEMPPLIIHKTTETLFRNLISFEQCCPNYEPIVTSYANLMASVIHNKEDVELLSEYLLIENCLNPGDVTHFFKILYNDAHLTNFYYQALLQEVKMYCGHWSSRLRYEYMHRYCGSPWAVVSQVVGTILLILTFLQTLFSSPYFK
ncbi:transmembrane protein [Citrus sinensis]|uniref:Uncharacterized protein n=3 Tax=Citrus TaxID=2706 RepID=A0A067EWP1_CITSI|nr:UPF0481 protein At3g47200 [Citrus x clementina]XP_024047392.1 UPF0481 protein At3g47200 [Citrus x clementina]XP_024951287.1 UPF0481 protein At3g47200 [Citrus sinensis]XP_052291262.1 UPF0481 protein At3g47200 [Citrus sinensis]GAY65564.1 hypothetical protein CUMW_242140 [Citrus unshiu]KAH9743580.1 transmembrane protein [Citrus sinensis]KDO55622.1 hypothetical protein CISIN_1g046543mg [Citrus sinensis]